MSRIFGPISDVPSVPQKVADKQEGAAPPAPESRVATPIQEASPASPVTLATLVTPAPLARARAAELKSELSLAAALYAEAGRPDEVARVVVARGDAEGDASLRLRHYAHAVATAPLGSAVHVLARRKYAAAVVALAGRAPLTAGAKSDLARAAADLEALADYAGAAAACALAGDLEGQARLLARAGDVDGLEALLSEAHRRDRDAAALRRARDEFALLVASGQRREAVAMARTSGDAGLAALGGQLESRRVGTTVLEVALDAGRPRRWTLVLGDEVVVGRAPEHPEDAKGRAGIITVASPLVSRRHLAIRRVGDGVLVRDLSSRHGTFVGGRPVPASGARIRTGLSDGEAGDAVEFLLGREVRVVVRPTSAFAGGVAIAAAGMELLAPLGPAHLGIGDWRLERGDDGWVELVTGGGPPAFGGPLRLVDRITLLGGDAIAQARGGPAALEILPRGA